MPSSLGPSVGNDVFAHHGRQVIARFLTERLASGASFAASSAKSDSNKQKAKDLFQKVLEETGPSSTPGDPVGILGAGASGLYTALILHDLGIPFKIIEGRDRVGGRLYTHTFPNQTGAPYNYFDVGAMRFPKINSMNRVFHLFDYPPLNTGDIQLAKRLRPFIFACDNAFLSYNGLTVKQNAVPSGDPFQAAAVIEDANPAPYIAAGTKAITDDVINPFATRLLDDMDNNTSTGWEYMRSFDLYSTRAYMSIQYRPSTTLNIPNKPLPVDVVNWCEAFDKSTGWYDRGLTETVLEAIAFGWKPSTDPAAKTDWKCIDGGSVQIANSMYAYLKQQHANDFSFSQRVTAIKLDKNNRGEPVMDVTTDNYDHHRFSHVITTIPLPVLRSIDMSEAGLSPMQANAIRQLNYGPSVKIGMQFRTAWWTTANDKNGRKLNIIGGQSYTDSPLRTVVYPSFGDVQNAKTTTLIASYCWTEDSERLAALITNDKNVLQELTLRELSKIHNVTIDFLRGQLIDTFAWSWSQDPFTMGAFAFFGPGKFDDVYTSLTNPAASGRLHFAGEALSVRHAWVEGALDSAWRAVMELLLQPGFTSYQKKFFENWGLNAEWFASQSTTEGPTTGGGVQIPHGRFEVHPPGHGQELDVDALLRSSLLVQHIAATHPEL